MPFWLPGGSTCKSCGGILLKGDDVFMTPPAWLPFWEPMTNFRGAAFHRTCWLTWSHRHRFIERVNATDSGYRFDADDQWRYIGAEGSE